MSFSPWPRAPGSWSLYMRVGLAALLVAAYAYYVRRTLHSGGALEEVPESLTLWRFGSPAPTWAVVAQALFALALIVVGAEVFVEAVGTRPRP